MPFDPDDFTTTAAALVEPDAPEVPVDRLAELIEAATVPEQRRPVAGRVR